MQGWNGYPQIGNLYPLNPNVPTYLSSTPLTSMDCVVDATEGSAALFIGDYLSVRTPSILQQSNIRAILSCGDQCNDGAIGQGYSFVEDIKCISTQDNFQYDMSQHFNETYEFIEKNLKGGRNTVVQCHAGKSRSATIILAYLMRKYQMTYQKALAFLRQKRPRAKPNEAFVAQLKQFEHKLFPGMVQEAPNTRELTDLDKKTPEKSKRAQSPKYGSHTQRRVNPQSYGNYQQALSMSAPQDLRQINPYYPTAQFQNPYAQHLARHGMYASQIAPETLPSDPYRQSGVRPFYQPYGQTRVPNANPYANLYGGVQWR